MVSVELSEHGLGTEQRTRETAKKLVDYIDAWTVWMLLVYTLSGKRTVIDYE